MAFLSTLDRRPVLNYNRRVTYEKFGRFVSEIEFSDTFQTNFGQKFRTKISETMLNSSYKQYTQVCRSVYS